jgi:hypothetical protein
MDLKKLGAVLLAALVLGAIVADSAFAANEYAESPSAWYTGPAPGSKLAEGASKELTTTAVGTQRLASTIGGAEIEFKATGVNCLSCKIKNTGTTAKVEGSLEFTGVTVGAPATCSVPGGKIITNPIAAVVGMNTANTIATLKFTPQSGTNFATFEITGASCPLAGLNKIGGTLFGQATNATGVFGVNQEVTFSQAIQESAGTGSSLTFNGNEAILTGAVKNKLSSEKEFAVMAPRSIGKPFEESPGAWYTGASPGTKLAEGTAKTLTTEVGSGGLELESSVAGIPLDLKATGISCVSCTVENVGTKAIANGTLKLTGVSASEPANCGVPATIETKKVKATVGMEEGSATVALIKFVPKEGTSFATVELTGEKCAVAGLYKLNGTLYAKGSNATGAFGNSQPILFDSEIQESIAKSLKFGENAAFLTGTVSTKLSPEEEFAVNSAANQYEESPSSWYTGASPGTKLAEGTTKAISTEAATKLTLESTVSGKHLDLTAFGLECSGCVIKNVGTKAIAEGSLRFKEVALTEPEPTNCGVTGTIETKKLKATIGMQKGSATIATIKFVPESGTTIASLEITGAKCTIAGTYNLTGAFYAEATNATGVFGKSQPIKLSQLIQETAGSPTSMKLGESNAFLTGTANLNAEVEYAAKEK